MLRFIDVFLVLVLSLAFVDNHVDVNAFVTPATNMRRLMMGHLENNYNCQPTTLRRQTATQQGVTEELKPSLTHDDVLWKIRPPPHTSFIKKILLRLAANGIRLDCFIKRQDPPRLLCPKGGQAVLEAYYKAPDKRRRKKIARFGITTERGPSSPVIQETVKDIYGIDLQDRSAGIAAIIYMFVVPQYRSLGIGELALQVILAIHGMNGCDFTILVTDDNGSGKLVQWYENNGFSKAPKLQNVMGSPGAKYGETMIAPTLQELPETCKIKWW